jgi:hypothetical protein
MVYPTNQAPTKQITHLAQISKETSNPHKTAALDLQTLMETTKDQYELNHLQQL